ncbi:MAG TPA: hypothetical protein VLT32_19150 [Candidatus Sulfomarinibacteraceae bacterium]|nr:hypothetical protein [Candidatus Sulfomarinibacteraceae bacterium]
MQRALTLALTVILPAISAAAQPTAVVDGAKTAGVSLVATIDAADPSLVRCAVNWLAPSDRARVSVMGSASVVAASGAAFEASSADSWESAVAPVAAGDRTELLVALHDSGTPVVVIAERAQGNLRFQAAVTLERTPGRTRISAPTTIRVRHERLPSGGGSIVAEQISPKIAIAAEVFVDDPTDYPIPDGPTDCSSGSTIWPLTTILYVSSAPAGATVTGLTVHVSVTHPDMSDMQIVFAKEFNTVAKYLWYNGAGANLDRDYIADYFSGSLPGIGGLVNGTWVLALRDCYAGATGTLTYWSVRIQYNTASTIDLVADSLTLDTVSVAPGGAVRAEWSGHVAGTGTVGGPFNVGFYLSTDSTITTGDTLLAQTTVTTAVNPGDTFGQASPGRQLTIPAGTPDGPYYVGMVVDSGGAVGESNEGNNTAWDSLTVDSGGGGGCQHGVTELYLLNGRFRITGGAFLGGVPTDFYLQNLCPNGDPSETAAAFYFNVAWPPVQEGFISVRDGCSGPRNAYIVEVACASTRKFYIDVTDTWTSTTHRYQNPTGGSSVCFPADATSFQGSCP